MKNKLIAAALALCLVLGLLPMAAIAATYRGTLADGTEVEIEVDDTTGAITVPSALAEHYAAAPDTLTLTDGKLPTTADFTFEELDHYGAAPGTITIAGTLVEAPFTAFDVSFWPSNMPSSNEVVKKPVSTPEEAAAWKLPDVDDIGFTKDDGSVFAGWCLGSKLNDENRTLYQAGEEYPLTDPAVAADALFIAIWIEAGNNTEVTENADGSVSYAPTGDSITEVKLPEETLTELAGSTVEVATIPADTDYVPTVEPTVAADKKEAVMDALKKAQGGVKFSAKKGQETVSVQSETYITITISVPFAGKYQVYSISDAGVMKNAGNKETKGSASLGFYIEVKTKHLSEWPVFMTETTDTSDAAKAAAADGAAAVLALSGAGIEPDTDVEGAAAEPPVVKGPITVTYTSTLEGADKAKFYYGKLSITNNTDAEKIYLVSEENAVKQAGKDVRVCQVVTVAAGETESVSCQPVLKVMVYDITEVSDISASDALTVANTLFWDETNHCGVLASTIPATAD